ncbi:3-hydroxyisobutyryl-CoA hydrolase, mitochondrial-like [Argonauta hians]
MLLRLAFGCLKQIPVKTPKRCFLRQMSTISSENDILVEKFADKGVVTLNRPKALNALSLPMTREIYKHMLEWENTGSVSMVIMKGAGGKAFCAGGDIVAVTTSKDTEGSYAEDFFKEEYILDHKIGTYKYPFVALIDGITMGGGVGLSVHGMFRVATEKTMFAMPETAIGLFPDVGGSYFLPRLQGNLGVFLALTGFRLKGRDVYNAGIATHFVERSKLEDLQKSLVDLESPTQEKIAQVLNDFQSQSKLDESKEFALAPHMDKINKLFNGNTVEDIIGNLKKDGSEWSTNQLNILSKMSPTSLKVTLLQLQEGAKKDLASCLQMEYRMSQHFVEDSDFTEGVRALLVDKDQKPVWNPANLSDVKDQKVKWYFSELPANKEWKLP